jgi:hypothetical protein
VPVAQAQRPAHDLYPVYDQRREGRIDSQGHIVIPAVFEWIGEFDEKGLAFANVCDRHFVIDTTGKILPPGAKKSSGPRWPKTDGDRGTGFIDELAKWSISPKFEDARPFQEGLAAAKLNGKWGFIDKNGRFVIDPQFVEAYYFNDGIAVVETKDKNGVIDRSGRMIAEGLDFIDIAAEGRIPESRKADLCRYGYLDYSGNQVIPELYDETSGFSEGIAAVRKDGNWGYIDRDGKTILPFIYDRARSFSNGLAAVKIKDGKWGYIDRDGKTVLPFIYDRAGWFSNGLASVKIGDKYGFIRKSGDFAFTLPSFDNSSGFDGVLVQVLDDSQKLTYLTPDGKVIWGPAEAAPELVFVGVGEEATKMAQDYTAGVCHALPSSIRKKVMKVTKGETAP